MQDYKPVILEHLQILLRDRKAENNVWKVRAYAKAIKNIQNTQGPIRGIDDLKTITGLGKSIMAKLEELINNGHIAEVDMHQNDETNKHIELLMTVSGVGPVKAKELVHNYNIKSIEDLRERFELLNEKQMIGLKYYEDFQERIPRKEMNKHAEFLYAAIADAHANMRYQITGSYRRGAEDSGDIDVLISCDDLHADSGRIMDAILGKLHEQNYLHETLAKGDKKYMGVCKLKRHKKYRRLDIIYTSPAQYPFALLYFTGSGDFNVQMRQFAIAKGYSLSEYGLKHLNGPKKDQWVDHVFRSENDIFDFLGVDYVEPVNRATFRAA